MSANLADELSEAPIAPTWTPRPTPGAFGRWLMRLAGVDVNLALAMPLNEQEIMKYVGAAMLAGAAPLAAGCQILILAGFGLQKKEPPNSPTAPTGD